MKHNIADDEEFWLKQVIASRSGGNDSPKSITARVDLRTGEMDFCVFKDNRIIHHGTSLQVAIVRYNDIP